MTKKLILHVYDVRDCRVVLDFKTYHFIVYTVYTVVAVPQNCQKWQTVTTQEAVNCTAFL